MPHIARLTVGYRSPNALEDAVARGPSGVSPVPEGDTVFRAARRLDAALTGHVLNISDFRIPRYATLNFVGWRVESVVSRGKHLLIRLVPPAGPHQNQPGVSIHSHLLMEGHWDVYASGERWRSPSFQARCVLGNSAFQAVGFELGFLRVLRTHDEQEAVGHLGPDPLGHSWDPIEAQRRLMLDPERPIGLALLDQRLVSGLGNIYRCEVLFISRIHPHTPVGQIADLGHVVEVAHQLLHANKDRARRMTTGASGPDPYWVYGRTGKPCLRCGGTLSHERMADPQAPGGQIVERDLYFCPSCQSINDSVRLREVNRA